MRPSRRQGLIRTRSRPHSSTSDRADTSTEDKSPPLPRWREAPLCRHASPHARADPVPRRLRCGRGDCGRPRRRSPSSDRAEEGRTAPPAWDARRRPRATASRRQPSWAGAPPRLRTARARTLPPSRARPLRPPGVHAYVPPRRGAARRAGEEGHCGTPRDSCRCPSRSRAVRLRSGAGYPLLATARPRERRLLTVLRPRYRAMTHRGTIENMFPPKSQSSRSGWFAS